MLDSIKKGEACVSIADFTVNGSHISFSHENDNFHICKMSGKRIEKEKSVGNQIDIEEIREFIINESIVDINTISIRYTDNSGLSWRRKIKDILDFRITHRNMYYTTKSGQWHYLNDRFMDYLKKSLSKISLVKMDDLVESDYKAWKKIKEASIAAGTGTDKITYREYYFNEKLSNKNGYLLLDRKNHTITTLAATGNNYQVELADLYFNGEAISLKISEDKSQLIYNAFQSLTALELYCQGEILTKNSINKVALWIVHKDPISSIFDFNSIQLLLAIENWRSKAQSYGLEVKIYHSEHKK